MKGASKKESPSLSVDALHHSIEAAVEDKGLGTARSISCTPHSPSKPRGS